MSEQTDIQWCDSSLNLQMGCDGCELWNPKAGVKICYAGKLHERWAGRGSKGWPESFAKPKLFLERLAPALKWPDLTGRKRPGKPWLNGLPRLIFLDDMGDTFTESLPLDWLAPLLPRMADSPHQWLLLTKRANRMEEFSKLHPFPPNFWLMTSITCSANENRIVHLLRCKGGSVRGISYEPATELVDFTDWLYGIPHINWIIAGGASGVNASPFDIQWARRTMDDCSTAGCAFHLKQLGADPWESGDGDHGPNAGNRLLLDDGHGGDWSEWPSSLRVRQFPEPRHA